MPYYLDFSGDSQIVQIIASPDNQNLLIDIALCTQAVSHTSNYTCTSKLRYKVTLSRYQNMFDSTCTLLYM